MATATTEEKRLTAREVALELYSDHKSVSLSQLVRDFCFGGYDAPESRSLTTLRQLWADGDFNEVNGHLGQPHDGDSFRVSAADAIRVADVHGIPRRSTVAMVARRIARREEAAELDARKNAFLSNRIVQLLEDRRAATMQLAKQALYAAIDSMLAGDESQLEVIDRLAVELDYSPAGIAGIVQLREQGVR